MNVVLLATAQRRLTSAKLGHWCPDEISELMCLYRVKHDHGEAVGFAYGETDFHDPQFYVLHDDLAQSCTACVSRLVRNDRQWYVIEDGQGVIQAEGDGLRSLISRICGCWHSARHTLAAAVTLIGQQYVNDTPLAANLIGVIDGLSAIA